MIDGKAALLVLLLAFTPLATANEDVQRLTIGYLELENDPAYEERTAYARIQLRSRTRPFPGAELAIADAEVAGRFAGIAFDVVHQRASDTGTLIETVRRWNDQDGINHVLLDLPADVQLRLLEAVEDRDVALFNVSSPATRLRNEQCHARLFHALPDYSMLTDALMQFLVSRKWLRLLMLEGAEPEDKAFAEALEKSADRFGAEIVARRDFVPGNDPRKREQTNIALLTESRNHDVVIVADIEGEFGRYVPYKVKHPRPVAGTTGLTPVAWSHVYERHGAPQVNDRFEKHAGRPMQDKDWAAWVAVKSISQAAIRAGTTDFSSLLEQIEGNRLHVDGAKGPALSYRPWNRQLRQPIFLVTHDAVIARAPIDGFLHPVENMDTLGADERDSSCSP